MYSKKIPQFLMISQSHIHKICTLPGACKRVYIDNPQIHLEEAEEISVCTFGPWHRCLGYSPNYQVFEGAEKISF